MLVSDIYQKINEWNQYENGLYRYKTKKIQVNVIGYADKQGSGDVFSRMKMNQELSEARAKSVTNYLSSKLFNNSYMQCEFNPIGLGEALPPDVLENNVADNPRRRLCLISVVVMPEM